MTDTPDAQLLEQFARNESEAAFAELVRRHIGLVYSVAFRKTGNPQQAQDVTQAVFIVLARKAGSLSAKTVLPGWLYHTARLTAANAHRAEMRRIRREQEASMQTTLEESSTATDAAWRELSPQLDEAMACLGTSERDALVLRYFQNKSVAEVGTLLGVQENTAQKRVGRALEKLRKFFAKRGVASTTVIIAGAISANSVQAAPMGLAQSISTVAVAKGAAVSTSTLTLVKGALKVMAWTKGTTITISAGLIVIIAATTVVVHNHTGAARGGSAVESSADYWAMTDLSNAGYGDPKSALKTTLFAMAQADARSFLASCVPNLKAEKEKAMQGKSEAEISAEARRQLANVTAFRIRTITTVSADTVIFSLHLEGANQDHKLVFKRMSGEWKLASST